MEDRHPRDCDGLDELSGWARGAALWAIPGEVQAGCAVQARGAQGRRYRGGLCWRYRMLFRRNCTIVPVLFHELGLWTWLPPGDFAQDSSTGK